MTQKRRHNLFSLYRILFLDLLYKDRTRRIMLYTLAVIGAGAALYRWLEGWSWLDSFYFVVITLTTIGYGDMHPTTPTTKLITIFYALNGIVIILMLFDVVRSERGRDIDVTYQSHQVVHISPDENVDQSEERLLNYESHGTE